MYKLFTIGEWAEKHDLPLPPDDVANCHVWVMSDVLNWYDEHGWDKPMENACYTVGYREIDSGFSMWICVEVGE